MVGVHEHSFADEAIQKGIKAYRKLLEREAAADGWMSNPETPEKDKLEAFFKYYAEIVCARQAYERLFQGIGVDVASA